MTGQELVYESDSEVKAISEVNNGAITQSPTYDLLQIAISRDLDVGKIERYMELYNQDQARLDKKSFFKAKSEFHSKLDVIEKLSQGQSSKFASLADIESIIKKPLGEAQLSYHWESEQKDNKLYVTCFLTHADGHSICTTLSAFNDKTGNKNDIQALGSSQEYLQRYTLKSILGLSSANEDDGNAAINNIERITETQAADLQAMIDEFNDESKQATKDHIYGKYKTTDFSMIPALSYEDVVRALQNKRKADARRKS